MRRMSATGHGIGILADATDSTAVLEQLERGNRALFLATCGKTRLVRLNEETEKTVRDDVEAAGYCCLEEKLDRSRYNLGSTANANALLQRVVNYRGPVSIWLADRVSAAGLRAFLTIAGQVDDRCRVLTEIT